MPTKISKKIRTAEAELEAALWPSPSRDAATCVAALERVILLARTNTEAHEYFDLPELYETLAYEYENLGRIDNALAAMHEAIAAGWDGKPDGRCVPAEIKLRAGRVDEAAAVWAQVKVDTPDDVWLYNSAGVEYADAGHHDRAGLAHRGALAGAGHR